MKLKIIILIIVFALGFNKTKSQGFSDESKDSGVKEKEEKLNYAILEFVIRSKQKKESLNSVFIQVGRIGVIVNNEKGYSKFFVIKGKYKILIKAVGYKDKIINSRKFLTNKTYKIEIEMEEKTEIMN